MVAHLEPGRGPSGEAVSSEGGESSHLGTLFDGSKPGAYARKALKRAKIGKHLQPWHSLRHTALTFDAAVGPPNAYVQGRAGHSQYAITEATCTRPRSRFPGLRSEARSGSAGCSTAPTRRG